MNNPQNPYMLRVKVLENGQFIIRIDGIVHNNFGGPDNLGYVRAPFSGAFSKANDYGDRHCNPVPLRPTPGHGPEQRPQRETIFKSIPGDYQLSMSICKIPELKN